MGRLDYTKEFKAVSAAGVSASGNYLPTTLWETGIPIDSAKQMDRSQWSQSGGSLSRTYVNGGTAVATTVNSSDTWTDLTGASVTVVPTGSNEKWEINFQGTLDIAGVNSNDIYANVRIVDSSNNLIDSAVALLSVQSEGAFFPNGRVIRLVARDTISASKTYKVQIRKGTNGTYVQAWVGNYTGGLTDPDLSQKIYAVKVPAGSVYVPSGVDISTTTTALDDTWVDVTGASVAVTPAAANERVEIVFRGALTMNLAAGVENSGNIRIVDSANNVIDNAVALFVEHFSNSFNSTTPVQLIARDIISAAKTYKLQIRKSNANSVGVYQDTVTGELTDPDVKQLMYAHRFPTAPTYVNSGAITSTSTALVDTWVDVTGASLTVTPDEANEKWEINFQGLIDMLSSSQIVMVGNIRIVDSADSVIDDSTALFVARTNVTGAEVAQTVNILARDTISAPKTYKLQIRKGSEGAHMRVLGGTDFTAALTDADLSQRFYAVRYKDSGAYAGAVITVWGSMLTKFDSPTPTFSMSVPVTNGSPFTSISGTLKKQKSTEQITYNATIHGATTTKVGMTGSGITNTANETWDFKFQYTLT